MNQKRDLRKIEKNSSEMMKAEIKEHKESRLKKQTLQDSIIKGTWEVREGVSIEDASEISILEDSGNWNYLQNM